MSNDKQHIKQLVQELTLEEKAALGSGKSFWVSQEVDRLGIPSVMMTDGPHGIRKVDETKKNNVMQESHKATCFPAAVTVASTWSTALAYEVGSAIADEAKHFGVATVLGPGVNIKRSPLCGRNFEYFSEDPVVSGHFGAAFVKGVQDNGVGTSLKHYCANNQEHLRLTISAEADERTMREIYLAAFEYVIKKAKPTTVMCSYNRVNGVQISASKKYLTDILRGEWGYDGLVMSDWGAVDERTKAVEAGLDLQMPSSLSDNKLVVDAVKSGELSDAILDKNTERVVKFALDGKANEVLDHKADFDAHHALVRKVAAEGAVLLKNENAFFPLDKTESDVLFLGALARTPRYQGTGSSKINSYRLVSFTESLDAQGISYRYLDGYRLTGDGFSKRLLIEARNAAKSAKKIVIFAGLTPKYEGEGFDRAHLNLPAGQLNLINEICKVNENVAVVLSIGAPIKMPFASNVKAILNLYLGGEACGEAAADIIFGDANPSGKLAESFPLSLDDVLANKYFPMGPRTVEYRENIFVGYRYFDTAKKSVLFPFGYGLSYTEFIYSDLKLSGHEINEDEPLHVSFRITNTGNKAGAEAAQLYVADKESTIFRPEKELKAFQKVYLAPNESATVEFVLNKRAFAYYNVNVSDWVVESGEFTILIGKSSREIVLKETLAVAATKAVKHPNYRTSSPSYYKIGSVLAIPDGEFEKLTGRKVNPNQPYERGEFDRNSTLDDIRITPLGALLRIGSIAVAKFISRKSENKDMIINSVTTMPLRSADMIMRNQKAMKFILNSVNGTKKTK
ncbi:MAG: glycoside hydrolase family 3 C-terminal domain-containing protein [Clostridiales bacterium]|jgi:beta-glucosidase|nr:glycoside hydrolase family 3 C-terminal domain-containing protein [Clostridiales bacterium]